MFKEVVLMFFIIHSASIDLLLPQETISGL